MALQLRGQYMTQIAQLGGSWLAFKSSFPLPPSFLILHTPCVLAYCS
jgi:hypothetical protein